MNNTSDTTITESENTSLKRLLQLCGLILLMKCALLGVPAITDPSEGRYAAMAVQMLESHDYIMPTTFRDGESLPFLAKPPLQTWLTALSIRVFGVNEFAARFPSFIGSLLTAWIVFFTAKRLFGAHAGALSALVFLASGLVLALSGGCIIDPLLTLATTAALASTALLLFDATLAPQARERLAFAPFVALGFAMLIKGPIAIVLYLIPIVLWLLLERRWDSFRLFPWVGGLGVFGLIWIPWYVIAEINHPGFLQYFFIHEHILRFISSDYGDLYGSGHKYIRGASWIMLAIGALPWTLLLIAPDIRRESLRAFLNSSATKFILLCGLSPAVFFTLARQISPTYLLPAFPGLSIFLGVVLANLAFRENVHGALRLGAAKLMSWLTLIAIVSSVIITALGAVYIHRPILWSVCSGLLIIGHFFFRKQMRGASGNQASTHAGELAMAMGILYSALVMNAGPYLDPRSSSESVVKALLPLTDKPTFAAKVPHSAYFYYAQHGRKLSDIEFVANDRLAETTGRIIAIRRKDLQGLPQHVQDLFSVRVEEGDWRILTRR